MACSDKEDSNGSTPPSQELTTPEAACSARCPFWLEIGCPDQVGQSLSECEMLCLQTYEFLADCEQELLGLQNCSAAQDEDNFECSTSGEAVLKEGFCAAERERYVDCVSRSLS